MITFNGIHGKLFWDFMGPKNTKRWNAYKMYKCIFQKCVMLHSFKQNGLQIRNQRKKLHMVAPGKMIFRRNFHFWQKMLDFESYNVKNSSK